MGFLKNQLQVILNGINKYPSLLLAVLTILLLFYWFALPQPLFQDSTSPVLTDRNQNLLGARVAKDGQWRFPTNDTLPAKFIAAITEFEDRRFFLSSRH